jgi:Zn finger protein HypA/HybF involved in hydrogenase expression
MNWNAARPETVKCAKCSHEWQPRTGIVTKHCPRCKTKKWNGATSAPSPEPQTQLDRFNSIDLPDEPTLAKCPKCSHEWQSRTDAPKKCPRCQARLDATVKANAARAARALAALGTLIEETPEDHRFAWQVIDSDGSHLGNVKSALVIRAGLDSIDKDEHYPVLDWQNGLYGWIRRDAPFERKA